MIEIRWHGRGGQGVVTAAVLLARAVINENRYAQAFAEFGPERRGAPVVAFTRIDDKPIYVRCNIYNPDIVVILTPALTSTVNVTDGLKNGGGIIINTTKQPEEIKKMMNIDGFVATVNATKISIDELSAPIVNTAILGSVVRATELVKLDTIVDVVRERFKGGIGERNVKAVLRAYEETKVLK
ncbi:MAG: pyruvate ferredoxin oxidoreductase subunit gamma [Nitrososphaerota archaeon]|nr:pyruvate ferredoxin oxidoreductase subunit gamma [Nitrososphaerales archaeon]MDW8045335.1 pyruvate ferredoxin oxidoreductase subunit gamma [Nitrososphaerota archaeon]